MTRRELALSLLEDAGELGVTTAELLQAGVGSRYGARIMELRDLGYIIETKRLREGSWRYTLIGREVGPLPSPPSLSPDEPATLFEFEPQNAALKDFDD